LYVHRTFRFKHLSQEGWCPEHFVFESRHLLQDKVVRLLYRPASVRSCNELLSGFKDSLCDLINGPLLYPWHVSPKRSQLTQLPIRPSHLTFLARHTKQLGWYDDRRCLRPASSSVMDSIED
jgi:hypothetical protein